MAQVFTVDYKWCTGCHSCEIACQIENELPAGQFGIKIAQIGPWQYGPKQWQYTYLPVLTDQCSRCGNRVKQGKLPSCVQHCQANCIKFVDADAAAKSLKENDHILAMTI